MLTVLVLSLLTRWVGTRRVKLGMAEYRSEDLRFLKELIEGGGYRAVIVTTTLPCVRKVSRCRTA